MIVIITIAMLKLFLRDVAAGNGEEGMAKFSMEEQANNLTAVSDNDDDN